MDIDNDNAVEIVDEFGRQCVRILTPRYHPEYAGKTISHEELTRFVKIVKKDIRDPEFNVMKDVYDILFPLRRKLPINGDT